MIENAQIRQFLSYKWPQYLFLMVFMMVYLIPAVCECVRLIIIWIALILTSIDVNLMSKMIENLMSKIIENTQNRQFLS